MKRVSVLALLAFVGVAFFAPTMVAAQQGSFTAPGALMDLRLPNGAGKSLLSQTAWGASYQTIFLGGGYQKNVPFDDVGDAGMGVGIGLLDPVLNVGVEFNLGVNDVSEMGEFSLGAKLHRFLGYGTAFAVGVEDMYSNLQGDAGEDLEIDPTFFAVVSHTLQNVDGIVPGAGKVHFSIGLGNGRFSEMPQRTRDVKGKENGSWVFGNAAVEVVENLNIMGEWDGIGLNAGFAYTLPLDAAVAMISAGVADITEYSTDQPRFLIGGAIAYTIF